jgi:hypothetical protein
MTIHVDRLFTEDNAARELVEEILLWRRQAQALRASAGIDDEQKQFGSDVLELTSLALKALDSRHDQIRRLIERTRREVRRARREGART